jgi:hypothetical protein
MLRNIKIHAVLCVYFIEIRSFNIYSTIAYNMGLKSLYLDAKIIKRGKKISGDVFELDLGYCERFLQSNLL